MLQPLRHKVSAGVLALAGTFTPAAAQSAPPDRVAVARAARPVIVLESYVGERPATAAADLAPLLDELEARGFVTRPASVLALVGGRAPRPGALDKDRTAAELTQPAESGYAAYTRGRFAEAEAALALALEEIHRNPALLVLDTDNLGATFKILAALALSQAKRGDTGASVATMVELIRTFRSQPITRTDYGPDAEQLYRAVWRQVQGMGRGQLSVTVENDQAVIFVDGQIRGLGKASLSDLIPGTYRVFVQVPGTAGRQYEVDVTASRHAVLHVAWELDASLWLTDAWLGFVFATEAERTRQAAFAGALARRWGGGERIAVVGRGRLDGKPAVTGSLYDAAGNVVRGAAVSIDATPHLRASPGDASSEPGLRALARFLADGTVAAGVRVVRETDVLAGPAPQPGPRSRFASRLLVAAGAAAVITGSLLYAIDQDPGADGPHLVRNTAPAGIAVGSVGIAAMSVGLWLWTARRAGSSPLLAIGSSGGFIGWTGEL